MAESYLNAEFDEAGSGTDTKFSVAALVCFLLGLLSPIVLINVALISLAVLGIVLGIIALFRAEQRGISRFSRSLAIIGIAISLVSIGWSGTYNVLTRQHLFNEAARYGEEYLAALARGDIDAALEKWTIRTNTIENSSSPDAFNETIATIQERKDFLESPGRKEVIERGPAGKWQFDSRRTLRNLLGGTEVGVAFRDISRPKSPRVVLIFMRFSDPDIDENHFMWRVKDTQLE